MSTVDGKTHSQGVLYKARAGADGGGRERKWWDQGRSTGEDGCVGEKGGAEKSAPANIRQEAKVRLPSRSKGFPRMNRSIPGLVNWYKMTIPTVPLSLQAKSGTISGIFEDHSFEIITKACLLWFLIILLHHDVFMNVGGG